jgi:FtsP/CotA-like multicopper oxidase with cupredoxin domain
MLKSIPILALASFALGGTVTYNFDVGFVTAAPDGFSRQVIGINGQWPCPVIEANVGDTVVVHVTNSLGDETTGLHFHGIDQKGSQVMDGPSGVTQCPIPPGSSFTYSFVVCNSSKQRGLTSDDCKIGRSARFLLVSFAQQGPVPRWFERYFCV